MSSTSITAETYKTFIIASGHYPYVVKMDQSEPPEIFIMKLQAQLFLQVVHETFHMWSLLSLPFVVKVNK